ncbi:PQQ-dependent sugar dehydrogenase [Rhodococcus aerolatus]
MTGLLLSAALTVSGCARFADVPADGFRDAPPLGAGPEPTPQLPDQPQPGTSTPGSSGPPAPPAPCQDPDPAVVATCLGTTSGVAVLPGGQAALVGERRTGRVLQVAPQQTSQEVLSTPVDGSGDGGLLDLALSPTYAEDRLVYALVTTPADTRVVRLAPGDTAKPILTGIPRGGSGNTGSLAFDQAGELLVVTGDAGNPAAAADPAALGGKLLRVTAAGAPAAGNPTPGSAVLDTLGGTAAGVCTDAATGTAWVTDRAPGEDRLRAVVDGRLGPPVWTWPDRPGAAGCAAVGGRVAVALTGGQSVFVLTTGEGLAVQGQPATLAQGAYGRLSGADAAPDGTVWVGTVNTAGDPGATPGPTDDRVVRIQPPAGGGGGSPD